MDIEYLKLNKSNFFANSLDVFERYQKVEKCWRKTSGGYSLKDVKYEEDWSLFERREIAKKIIGFLEEGSQAFGAFCSGEIVGFALLDKNKFGSRNQYIDLAEFYVSAPYRRYGIGRKLFEIACAYAKATGALKLYISAHSAEDSIAAYISYGCVAAEEINAVLAEKEPFDLQLECVL